MILNQEIERIRQKEELRKKQEEEEAVRIISFNYLFIEVSSYYLSILG